MTRSTLVASALLSMLLTTACEKEASDMQRTANEAQKEADAKIAAASQEAGNKVDNALAEADEKIDDATAAADQEIRTVQAEADKKIAGERADFTTLREEYRHATTLKLVELDKKIADIDARAKKANGDKKADLETRLAVIRSTRDAFVADQKTLENESAATWDVTKARLDRAWAELEARVDAV
jgi:hypothetical protein